ncbi:PqqD family peptide modification chaperone [candidate division WOR-3 bacterium]|nr:PqqD family peptide modification chaperone [candidate division WOR-3 bacterium]
MSSEYYVSNKSISVRLLGESDAQLFQPDTGSKIYLNQTGLFIWKLLDGGNSRVEIVNAVQNEFDAPDSKELDSDIGQFLSGLEEKGYAHSRNFLRREPRSTYFIHENEAPRSIDISVTKNCNLNCKYCFYREEMKNREDLPLSEWEKFLEELKSLAVEEVVLSGGEVFCRKDLWDFIDLIVESNLRYSFLSNGTLFDDSVLSELEKDGRKKRLSSIQISIDGSKAEVHDMSRGKGSFEKAVRGLKNAMGAGLNVTVRLTVNRHNLGDLEEAAKFLLVDIGLPSFSTNDAIPLGAACWNKDTITLDPLMQFEAMKTLGKLQKQYDNRITAMAGPLAKWHLYRKMERMKRQGEKPEPWMGYLTGCGCPFSKLAVHHDGVFIPCNMLSKIELGQMNKDSLKDVWINSPILKRMRERRRVPMKEVPGCENCEYNLYCNGSCPALAGVTAENFILPNLFDCYKKFKEDTGRNLDE